MDDLKRSIDLEHKSIIPTDGTDSVIKVLEADPTAPVQCRFGDGHAIGVYSTPEGCACYHEDRVQALCPQHAINAEPLGSMYLLIDLSIGGEWSGHPELALHPIDPDSPNLATNPLDGQGVET